ncbi:hypothetical protein [Anabaena sp. UHCC 0451]|uniref:hypothetical protein n=1 Tax=Anabaena sp. UHCC 0451 TaxID=2055235 RepID=UPI002B1F6020|nr:hypothetical protein [Anabaena sp. UHCC 0451]MEA5576022.1 hypothetical protein [Anabaena sp. UHCC 0451]
MQGIDIKPIKNLSLFPQSNYSDDESKKLRSIRLTDTAWAKLDELAQENNLIRSEMIEVFARQGLGNSQESGE